MAKVSIDISYVKKGLESLGYEICDCIERDNNGKNWQIKFNNTGAIVTVYDTNRRKNSVVNGKCEDGEKVALKEIVDSLKCKEDSIYKFNRKIVDMINSKQEMANYDFKAQWHSKTENLLHDILCLSNNIENKDSFLIVGVTDKYEVIGVVEWRKSNDIYDFLRTIKFAGDHMPEVEMGKAYYKHKKVDVLMCKSSKNVPFYLRENFRGVHRNQIYTRVGDTNTPKNDCASYLNVETLWRIHFERENE